MMVRKVHRGCQRARGQLSTARHLFGGGVAQTVTGQLEHRHVTNDLRLRLGSGPRNRGRIEIR